MADGRLGAAYLSYGDDTFVVHGSGRVQTVDGGRGNDVISGNGRSERFVGGENDDLIKGGSGADILGGDGYNSLYDDFGGNDTIDGGRGEDRIDGGMGRDRLTGGREADLFVFNHNSRYDKITDFSQSEGDRIDLRAFGLRGFNDRALDIDVNGDDTVVTVDEIRITLADFTGSLDGSDFIF